MRLPLVASLTAAMALVGALPAVEIPTGAPPPTGDGAPAGPLSRLTIDGYGEAFTEVGHREPNNPFNSNAGLPTRRDEGFADFPSDLTLKLGYTYDDFTLRSDVIIASRDQFNNDNVLLEQMFIDWKADDALTIRAGRWQNTWLGWEGFHTPELWRVNHSAAWFWNIQNHGLGPQQPFVSDGLGALFTVPDAPITAQFFVVNDVLGDAPGQRPIDKAVGASFAWKPKGIGRFEFGLAFDPQSINNGSTTSGDNGFAADINADITAFKSSGWFFGAEAQVNRHPTLEVGGRRFGNDLTALAMANYRWTPQVSTTLMIDYVERGFFSDRNEVTEFAVAVLTKPRKQVLLNGEVFYWKESAREADSYGAAAVLCLLLP